jgi:hypothetical protein
MADITSKPLLYLKGALFLVGGLMASGLLILEQPTLKVVVLLAIAVWCFARAYYFAFYVIEHYVDPTYRFAGLWSFGRYLLRRKNVPSAERVKGERAGADGEARDGGP